MSDGLLGVVQHKLFGHRFDYEELDREETAVRATCVYEFCDYDEVLTEELFE
ncbi:hypothetical protein [Haloferax sp. Atlit-12N]|uniref:hypothetical protein n=1 Tax=Haloferax sp. Atlit-12N TaxID=2077203 RepID=UPI001314F1C4|nr:hypothetical protein [Haloferax sp. Atlit-12N]